MTKNDKKNEKTKKMEQKKMKNRKMEVSIGFE